MSTKTLRSARAKLATQILKKSPEAKFTAIWFFKNPKNGSLHGPFTREALRDALVANEVSSAFLVWNPKVAGEWATFNSFPDLLQLQKEIAKGDEADEDTVIAPASSERWFIHTLGGADGPFTMTTIRQLAKSGKITPPLFCWKKGLKEWVVYSRLEELRDVFQKLEKDRTESSNKRAAKRGPFLASVETLPAAGRPGKYFGIVRNISVSGLQVLGQPAPGPIGSLWKFRLNSNPVYQLEPLEVEVRITRALTGRVGFCGEFTRLPQKLIAFLMGQMA